jgi:ubiquinone biosynthesis monooxygenase Coq7
LSPIPPRPGPHAEARRLAEILRVDHAGEMGAVAIYRGQRAVFEAGGRSGAAQTLEGMEAQEARHLERFERMLLAGEVRPTLMAPVWRAAGFALGAATALLGESTAHACTEAVEEVIEAHYAGQIAELEGKAPELAAELTRFRSEEIAHHDEALEAGARRAPAHGPLTAAIRAACRLAIAVSEKI